MSVRILAAAVLAAGVVVTANSAFAGGGCGTVIVHGRPVVACHTPVYRGYSLVELREIYFLFKQNPILCQRHPDFALELNKQFGGDLVIPGAAAVVATPAVATTAVATPAVVATSAVDAAPTVIEGAAAATVVEDGSQVEATSAVASPAVAAPVDAAPADLPAGLPADLPAGAPADLPGGDVAPAAVANPAAAAASVPAELEPLLGLWENEAAGDEVGSVSQINLQNDGTATVTLNTAIGPATMTRPFAIEDSNFNLVDGEKRITLGQVQSADADRVVIKAGESTVTFTRPS